MAYNPDNAYDFRQDEPEYTEEEIERSEIDKEESHRETQRVNPIFSGILSIMGGTNGK